MDLMKAGHRYIILLLFFCHCTTVNFWYQFNTQNSTNPTPEYDNFYFSFIRGGGLFHLNSSPGSIASNAQALYSGEACSHSVLNLISFGNSSLKKASENGRIKKIASSSYEHLAFVGGMAYHRFCTTVTGE
jgi:hypothetical protein